MQNELFTKWRFICNRIREGTRKSPGDVLDGTAAAKIPARSGTRAALEVGVAGLNFDYQWRNSPSSDRPTSPGFNSHFGEA